MAYTNAHRAMVLATPSPTATLTSTTTKTKIPMTMPKKRKQWCENGPKQAKNDRKDPTHSENDLNDGTFREGIFSIYGLTSMEHHVKYCRYAYKYVNLSNHTYVCSNW